MIRTPFFFAFFFIFP
ncbi:pheA operon leader peptide PheL [Enterobacter sp. ECC-175]